AMTQVVLNLPVLIPYLGAEWEFQYISLRYRIENDWANSQPVDVLTLTKLAALTEILVRKGTETDSEELAQSLVNVASSGNCQISRACLNAVYSNFTPTPEEEPSPLRTRQLAINEALRTRFNLISNGFQYFDNVSYSSEIEAALDNGL
ncbi:MAG: hypothetical protein AAF202_11540, partial [Pseudomonadota bacterium]